MPSLLAFSLRSVVNIYRGLC